MTERLTAMISSTSVDLPEHRKEAIDACLREGFFPIAMEHLPARDADAIRVSLEMVDKADAYIGIYAWRYGHVPEGHDVSITEMEFNRAVERGIPILVFLIDKDHPLTIEMVEADKNAQDKLKKLKERASQGRGRVKFNSAVDLRSHLIQSLAALLKEQEAASQERRAPSLHPPNIIPEPPKPYIAHPYSLLQTNQVVGRRQELNVLTDWVTTNRDVPGNVRLFNVVAIGGMGKSALTWKWFNDIAPNELPHLAGRMWWSFYESDAYFENFVIRALAYAARMPEEEVRKLSSQDREDQLFKLLDERPFLLVLDGLERILLAYSRMDAAHLADDDLDDQTANVIARVHGLPEDVKETYLEKHRLRLCADPRAGRFLRRLANVRSSRLLISTRLYPAELQTNAAQPWPGCYAYFIRGLTDDDALTLWREFIGGERSGTSEQLLPLFRAFENYPLLVRALAGEVAEYKPAPGDFDRWREDHPDFNPAELPLKNARTHVLEFALRGLGHRQRKVLHTIAAFSMPARYDTLTALLIGGKRDLCRTEPELDAALTELEDRGLIGWDKYANRYDLHPIVRNVVWQALGGRTQKNIQREVSAYLDSVVMNTTSDYASINDLTPAIELYRTLVALERLFDAYDIFSTRLDRATDKLGASALRVELLAPLVESKGNDLPGLDSPEELVDVMHALGRAYADVGQIEPGLHYLHSALNLSIESPILGGPYTSFLQDLSRVSLFGGRILGAQRHAFEALPRFARKWEVESIYSESLAIVGMVFAVRGLKKEADDAFIKALSHRTYFDRSLHSVMLARAQADVWFRRFDSELLPSVWNPAYTSYTYEGDLIRATRLQGVVALGFGHISDADDHLHRALGRARTVRLVDEELSALIALAELRRQQAKSDEAREYLDDVWDAAERGPYPLFHSDAFNVLAQIERDAGNRDKAIEAATQAYRLAWCDGPPFAYHWGLVAAQKHLQELGAPEPEMPPFDESKFEPISEVEIDPNDEFHAANEV